MQTSTSQSCWETAWRQATPPLCASVFSSVKRGVVSQHSYQNPLSAIPLQLRMGNPIERSCVHDISKAGVSLWMFMTLCPEHAFQSQNDKWITERSTDVTTVENPFLANTKQESPAQALSGSPCLSGVWVSKLSWMVEALLQQTAEAKTKRLPIYVFA